MTRWLLLVFALVVGMLLPVQQGVNSTLTKSLASPLQGALISFATGTLALLVCCLALRLPLPLGGAVTTQPWWAWTGGLIGAAFVTAAIVLAPRLGATATASAVIAGQIAASLLLDHRGLLGFEEHPVNFGRLLGVLLLLVGVVLIRRF
jgi:bacterial/archaeal transporter family-2 protein